MCVVGHGQALPVTAFNNMYGRPETTKNVIDCCIISFTALFWMNCSILTQIVRVMKRSHLLFGFVHMLDLVCECQFVFSFCWVSLFDIATHCGQHVLEI